MTDQKKDHITNEALAKKFRNSFDLVLYAISLAKNMIKSGREPGLYAPTQNRATIVLREIEEGKDRFEDLSKSIPQNTTEHRIVELQSAINLFEEQEGKKKGA
jgi:hypothetical protein